MTSLRGSITSKPRRWQLHPAVTVDCTIVHMKYSTRGHATPTVTSSWAIRWRVNDNAVGGDGPCGRVGGNELATNALMDAYTCRQAQEEQHTFKEYVKGLLDIRCVQCTRLEEGHLVLLRKLCSALRVYLPLAL